MNGQLLTLIIPVLILGLIIKYLQTPKGKGRIAEWTFPVFIRLYLDRRTYRILNNITLRLSDGSTTQIDHVIVSRYGIFVIELKNYKGWIFGDEYSPQWTQSFPNKRKFQFQNPIRQNYRHVKALAALTGIPEEYFKPVVAFVGGCELKTIDKLPPNARYTGNVPSYIRSQKSLIIADEQVAEIVDAIRAWQRHGGVSNREHVQILRSRFPSAPAGNDLTKRIDGGDPDIDRPDEEGATRTCPNCGRELVVREARRGAKSGQQFLGCAGFPKCRYTEPLSSE